MSLMHTDSHLVEVPACGHGAGSYWSFSGPYIHLQEVQGERKVLKVRDNVFRVADIRG